jgi:hypothetical protein
VGTKNSSGFCEEKVRYYLLTLPAIKDIGCTLEKNTSDGKKDLPSFFVMAGANWMPNS